MSRLRDLLYGDLARYYELQGRPDTRPNALRLLGRLLHFRFLPNVICRTSRAAMLAGIPLLPGLLTYLNLVLFGLEATPKCEIGPGIFFAHPVGCVIGASRIGSNVTIFGGVTLGSRGLDIGFDPGQRPEVGDNVVLGSGCRVLGAIRVGDHATVGANAVVLSPVQDHATVVGIPARAVQVEVMQQ
ncbi:MAG TPA: serine acetyltransferase [Candidatus Binatia bacterium]|nr:serine acetyltransferase [Candidatus Binatia bacterium]